MLRRSGSIKLVDLFGIRIGVDASWFLVLFLMIFWLSTPFRATLHSSDGVAYMTTVTTVLLSLSWLVLMNVLILGFNLVPAFPLDGGRMARAVVWRISGSKANGTRAAALIGRGFALLLAGFGLWIMLALRSPFTGIWL